MTTYATLDDLIARASEVEIRQVADRNRDGVIDEDVVTEALIHADNIVNGYVASKYTLPFVVTPDLVRTWAITIARYRLHFQSPPEWLVDEYKEAIASLKDVARGTLVLPVASGEISATASATTMSCSPDEVFSSQNLRGWA